MLSSPPSLTRGAPLSLDLDLSDAENNTTGNITTGNNESPKPIRKPSKPRAKLTTDKYALTQQVTPPRRLCAPEGLPYLYQNGPKMQFRGKGHEAFLLIRGANDADGGLAKVYSILSDVGARRLSKPPIPRLCLSHAKVVS